MDDVEQLEQAVKEKLDSLLQAFNKTLEEYSLLELEVIGIRFGVKDDQIDSKEIAILKEFDEILDENGFEELYVSSFTLSKKGGREGLCQIKVEGFWITIRCGSGS